jgi:hypothetical protein
MDGQMDGRTDGRTDRRTDGHGETSIPPYNFAAGGINIVLINFITIVNILSFDCFNYCQV